MAINILKSDYKNGNDMTSTSIEVANGDLEALKEITDDYKLSDITDTIAFAIGILKKAGGRPIGIVHRDGRVDKYLPAERIMKNDPEES